MEYVGILLALSPERKAAAMMDFTIIRLAASRTSGLSGLQNDQETPLAFKKHLIVNPCFGCVYLVGGFNPVEIS